jgi:multidrug efflux pump subunit AcrB
MDRFRQEFVPRIREEIPGVSFTIAGETENTRETQASMIRLFLVGVVGIFLILSFQFRSFLEPFVVMVTIPFAFIGVVWGHFLVGLDLSMPSMMGFVSLAGIVVNDSILLVTFLKMNRREGMTIGEAARQASRERFRAVMLTSLTTIAGLLPLLSEKSLQAQALIPLAASLVFGLLASTVLVLVVIPCLYTIFGDLGLTREVKTDEDPPAPAPAAAAKG